MLDWRYSIPDLTSKQMHREEYSLKNDGFSRLRVSEPTYIFDAQFTYDLQPLLYQQVTAQSGATIAHSSTERNALMTFASTPTGGKAFMQTYEHFRYQPGRSQLSFITFDFKDGVANCLKFVGYSDGTNGIELQLNGTTPRLALYSGTTNGNQFVNQTDWNVDRMDGTGPSGFTVDWTKEQILVIDFQALYVGRVRVALDIDGQLCWVHSFKHANRSLSPYLQTANLPIRCGMTCTGTVSTTMSFNCCSVISEGGSMEEQGYAFTASGSVTAGSGTRTHILSVRPKTTFNSITNRAKFVLSSIDILVTGNNPIKWELCVGQALTTPTYADVNTTYSGFEYVSAATLSGSPAYVIESGFAAASNQVKQVLDRPTKLRKPISLDVDGAVRDLGTLSLLVTGIGSTSATQATLNWREIR